MLQLLSPTNTALSSSNNNKVNNTIYPEKKKSIKRVSSGTDRDQGADEKVAVFHRNEIKVGELVGTGSFSEVYEISSFDLINDNENTYDDAVVKRRLSNSFLKSSSSKQSPQLGPSRIRKRDDILVKHNQNTQEQRAGAKLQSRYVIKHLAEKLMQDPKLFKRAVRDMTIEAALMQAINHPHIARLCGTSFNGAAALADAKHDSFFLVLDRLYETLDSRIESWNRDKTQQGPSYYLENTANQSRLALKANYAWQIASALEYLHERRIIFRDLKPQNLGFKEIHPDHPERDVLSLFDFGLARNLPVESNANKEGLFLMSLVGTRRYMAPEVVLTKTYNVLADTYSWALVFFELVTQQRPYDGIQRNEHKEYICRQGKRPKLYSYYDLPTELETMLRLAWAQDISRRLSMSEVCNTLKTFLAGTIHEKAVLSEAEVELRDGVSPLLRDASFSSMNSTDTTVTEQSVSTAADQSVSVAISATNGEIAGAKEASQASISPTKVVNLMLETTKSEAPIAQALEVVPQAINVLSVETSTRDDAAYYTAESPVPRRRVSLCQRVLKFFRTGLFFR